MTDKRTSNRILTALWILLLVILGYALFALFSRFIGTNHTDFNSHIERALEGRGYSLNSACYRMIGGICNHTAAYAIYNVLIVLLTVVLSAVMMKRYACSVAQAELPLWMTGLFALSLILIGSLYIPGISPYFYRNKVNPELSPLVTQPWHSDTYNLMRLFASGAFFVFLIIEQNYRKKISFRAAAMFFVFLSLANWAKPSFFVCFAPALLVLLIIDFCRDKGKTVGQQFKLGLCVLLSAPVLLLQFEVLFGESTGNGMAFTLDRIRSAGLPEWGGVLLASLPMLVTATIILVKYRCADRHLWFAWGVYLVSLFWKLFFVEIGYRSEGNNFTWSAMICSFFLFSTVYLKIMCAAVKKEIPRRMTLIAGIGYTIHLICGVCYFLQMVNGSRALI